MVLGLSSAGAMILGLCVYGGRLAYTVVMATDPTTLSDAVLDEGIEALWTYISESEAQYRSEVALYGDAGPGQHPHFLADSKRDLEAYRAEWARRHPPQYVPVADTLDDEPF